MAFWDEEEQGFPYQVDVCSSPSGVVLMAVQVYWCPAGSTRTGFIDSWVQAGEY